MRSIFLLRQNAAVVVILCTLTTLAQPQTWTKLSGPWSTECDTTFGVIAAPAGSMGMVYVGNSHSSAGCGVFKSADGGRNWTAANNGIPLVGFLSQHYMPIISLTVAPSLPNVLYMGTGADGGLLGYLGNVYLSTNGGDNWTDAGGVSGTRIDDPVLDIAVDAHDPTTFYVASFGPGVFKSVDAGNTWQRIRPGQISPNGEAVDAFNVIRASASQAPVLLSAGFTSFNGPIPICAPQVIPGMPAGCINVTGVLPLSLLSSSAFGANWTTVQGPEGGGIITDIAIDPTNAKHIFTATTTYKSPIYFWSSGSNGLFESLDSGQSWKSIVAADDADLTTHTPWNVRMNVVTGQLFANFGDEGIFRFGSDYKWHQLPTSGLPSGTFVYALAFNENVVFATTSTGVYRYDDDSLSNFCSNPVPQATGFATPCPVLRVSPIVLNRTGRITMTAAPDPNSYSWVYTTIYVSKSGVWKPYNTGGPMYTNTTLQITFQSQDTSQLEPGIHYLAAWDWRWDSVRQCYIGPGSSTCNQGSWRIQKFVIE